MLDPTQGNQQGSTRGHGAARRAGPPVNVKLWGQMLLMMALVVGFLAYSVDNLIWAIQQHNTPELGFAGAGTILLLWLLYKIIHSRRTWWPLLAPRQRGGRRPAGGEDLPNRAGKPARGAAADTVRVGPQGCGLNSQTPGCRGRISGQRVLTSWLMGVVSTAYAVLSWVAYPKWPMSQHLLRALPAVVFLALAVLLTLVRRRQLSAANGARR